MNTIYNPLCILLDEITITYLCIKPFANSQKGILCDFVPPMVTISMSAVKQLPTHTNKTVPNIKYFMLKVKKKIFLKKSIKNHNF